MRRLFFMLAWAECHRASWMLAAGQHLQGKEALAAAFARLGDMASAGRRRRWRPLVQGGNHGLRVRR